MAKSTLLAVLLAVLSSGASYAVRPAYEGPLGNPEEPAMRPYKWLWHGVKALTYQPIVSLRDGNIKSPGIGSVDMFKGVRRGVVEMNESVARGICAGEVPAKNQYKELGTLNRVIEADPLLHNVADLAGTLPTGAVAGGVFVAQKVTDAYPTNPPAVVEQKREQMQRNWEKRKAVDQKKAEAAEPDAYERARKDYLGDRYKINPRDRYMGDLRKLVH